MKGSKKSLNVQILSLQELIIPKHVLQDYKANKRLFPRLEDKYFSIYTFQHNERYTINKHEER